jgi:hypothetical protein
VRLFDYSMTPLGRQGELGRVELNAPITERLRVTVREDRFFAGGKDLPLFGVNLGWALIDERDAFEFLASIGVNAVRILGPYRQWGGDGEPVAPSEAAVKVSRGWFDRLCRQQKICEELGIYVVIRDLAEGLGPPYYPAEDSARYQAFGNKDACSLGLWHSGVRELVMKRLEWLMTEPNPRTGRPFGASPALLGVQLTNETSWFADDPHLDRSRAWRQIRGAPGRILEPLARAADIHPTTFRELPPEERLLSLARATGDAWNQALELLTAKLGDKRPLLIADNAPWAAPVASLAYSPCDAYGWNVYPDHGALPESQAYVKPLDLRPERMLDRFQVRLAGKPTLVTECGERLASGGQSRLVADATVRAATYGYAGILFHFIYKGLYGEKSGETSWLASRTPRENYDLGCDSGALCTVQACSLAFRGGMIPLSPRSVSVSAETREICATVVRKGRQLDDVVGLASDLAPGVALNPGSLSTTLLLQDGPRRVVEAANKSFSGNIERGHVRCGYLEMDWGTYPDPEEDWLYIRVPFKRSDSLIVLVGRTKPMGEAAEQKFENGVAKLSGLKTYSWPDPRTGYGQVLFVRKPIGPKIRLDGKLWYVGPDGTEGGLIDEGGKLEYTLPYLGVRFLERR